MLRLSKKHGQVSGIILFIAIFFVSLHPVYSETGMGTDADTKITAIISQMTLEEKVAMLHGNSMFSSAGIERLGIEELKYTDGPFGVREELGRNSWTPVGATDDSATFFPTGPALAATWNNDLAWQYGKCLGAEARARGKDVLLGPALNIFRTPLCGRNFDYFTEDPFLNAGMTVNYVQGMQSQDVAACLKHYALNNQETERGRIDVQADERALREIYLYGFEAGIKQGGALTVMGSYNKFRGAWLCENDYLMNKILKDEWGFKGLVVSDWGATHSSVNSALYGLDVEMGGRGSGPDAYFMGSALLKAVQEGQVDEKIIDDKVRRILHVMFSIKKQQPNRATGALNAPEHRQTVYNVAAEAIVLLKNSAGVLPLDADKVKTLAVIGDNATEKHAQGGFGAGVKAKYEITPLAGLQNKLGNKIKIEYAQGYKKQFKPGAGGRRFFGAPTPDNTPDTTLIQQAVKIAKNSDAVVIFAGSNRNFESEARDRTDLQLPFGQVELIQAVAAVNPNTVVVMITGAAFDLCAVEKSVSALLWSSFNGSEAGNAYADVLFGQVNPSGKLPYTIPVKLDDIAAHALGAFPGENATIEYKESILVGYRWFDTKGIEPLYCFGHGLSYSAFAINSVKTDKSQYAQDGTIDVKVTVKNNGQVAGTETIQLYVHDTEASVMRPQKELKGYAKVFLKPGKKQDVHIKIPVKDLAFYDGTKMQWVTEPGQFELLAGFSSRDIHKTTLITVK